MTGLFLMGFTSLVESSAVGATAATIAALVRGRLTLSGSWKTRSARRMGISCMFMWIIMAALCASARYLTDWARFAPLKRFFVDRAGAGSLGNPACMMQLSYLLMGMFLDDTAMLVIVAPLYVPLVGQPWFRSDLVWRALYDHLSDRLHDARRSATTCFFMRAMAPPEVSLAGHLSVDRSRSSW